MKINYRNHQINWDTDTNKIISSKNKVTIDTNLLTSGGKKDPKYLYHKIKLLYI